MKNIFTPLLLLVSLTALSQGKPPDLIYACEKITTGAEEYDIYNSSGKKILPHSVHSAYSNAWSWIFVIDAKSKLITVYDHDGKEMGIDSIESTQSTYSTLSRIALQRSGKWGFYNRQGKRVIDHIYDEVSHFKNNIAAVKRGDDIFMIDTNGKKTSITYDPADNDYSFEDADIAIGMGGEFHHPVFKKITEKGKVGLLDARNNKLIIPVEYDRLSDLKEKFQRVTGGKNGKYGLIAFGGAIIIPLHYKSVFVLNDYF